MPLEDRFEIGLHLASRHLDVDGEGQRRSLLDIADFRAGHVHPPVLHLLHRQAFEVFEPPVLLPAELDGHILPADPLPFEGGAVTHRDRDVHRQDLEAADFDGPGWEVGVGDARYHVLVRAYAGREDLRDAGVGDDREAEIDRPGGGGVFFVVHLAQGQDEGEDTLLVI